MKQVIKIWCEVPDHVHPGQFKTVFSNTVELDDQVSFDYESAIKGLKVLFPNTHLIINLTLM